MVTKSAGMALGQHPGAPMFTDESRPERTLNNHQEAALLALLAGASVTEAAAQGGVTRQTASEWLHHDPDFGAALVARRAELWDSIRARFEQATAKAVDVLAELLDHEDPRIRLGAASRIVAAIAEHKPRETPETGRTGGALVVPGVMTPEDWKAVYGAGPEAE